MGSPNDLACLPDLKSWLAVSGADDDVLLEMLISRTSRAILTYLDRPSILPDIYVERFDGGNEISILLRQWPVTSVVACTIDGVSIPPSDGFGAAASMGYVFDPAEALSPGRMQRLSLRGGQFTYGVQNISVTYYAGYQVTNEGGVVPSTAPWQLNVLQPYGNFARDLGVTDTSGAPLAKVTGTPATGQYACEDGVYTFSAVDAYTPVLVSYGYVPADLARCCIDWAADQFQYRTRIGQHAKSLGGHESISFIVKDMPDFVRTVLQPYRRVVTP